MQTFKIYILPTSRNKVTFHPRFPLENLFSKITESVFFFLVHLINQSEIEF